MRRDASVVIVGESVAETLVVAVTILFAVAVVVGRAVSLVGLEVVVVLVLVVGWWIDRNWIGASGVLSGGRCARGSSLAPRLGWAQALLAWLLRHKCVDEWQTSLVDRAHQLGRCQVLANFSSLMQSFSFPAEKK